MPNIKTTSEPSYIHYCGHCEVPIEQCDKCNIWFKDEQMVFCIDPDYGTDYVHLCDVCYDTIPWKEYDEEDKEDANSK